MRRRGDDRKFQASRLAVGEECDLAILTVDDEEFWEGASPLAFGELPELTDDVNVIGRVFRCYVFCVVVDDAVVDVFDVAGGGGDLLALLLSFRCRRFWCLCCVVFRVAEVS